MGEEQERKGEKERERLAFRKRPLTIYATPAYMWVHARPNEDKPPTTARLDEPTRRHLALPRGRSQAIVRSRAGRPDRLFGARPLFIF